MATITSRQQLIDYCLRRLGEPVLEINVDIDQIEDKIDDALQVYQEFHSDATFKTYFAHLVTDQDVTNKYIDISPNIIYIPRLFPTDSTFIGSSNMFSFQYQFALSDFHNLPNMFGGITYYEQVRQYLSMLDMKLNGTPIVNFSRHGDRLYIHGEFGEDGDIKAGEYLIAEVYEIVDPETNTSVYNDMFIKDYTTSLIKQQWGMNMSKFEGMQLPGGVTISGRQMLDDANAELTELRERMRLEQEEPTDFFVG